MKKFAKTTAEGTAASETCLCQKHFNEIGKALADKQQDKDVLNDFVDASENEIIECIVCGAK